MHRKILVLLAIASWSSLFSPPSVAQSLQIMTEQDPPYSFTGADGKPTGYGIEVVEEIQRRLKTNDPISIRPWIRAYATISRNPNVVVFTMSRTKEREPLFQWVGPIIENDWVIVGKKSSKLKIANLNDAKKLGKIGVVKDYAWDVYLTSQGFHNLDRVPEYPANIRKAKVGRIQAFVSSNLSYQHELTEEMENPEDYEILMKFNSVQMYIAHSKDTDKAIVDAWQSAFESMKNDGTLARLLARWIPPAKLPGPAKAASF